MIAYPNVAERLFGRPLAIDPVALRAIMDGPLVRRVLSGEKIESKKSKKGRDVRRDRIAAIANAEPVRSPDGIVDYALTQDGVAIVPVTGVLTRRFDWLAAACGFTTYDGLGATFEAVTADYRVKAILLDVDSPGGEADGMLDVADAVLALAKDRPVWAVANTLAASAAYAIAGSATKLMLPRLAQVGSIGCVTIHVDQSGADKAAGLNYTAIYSGARKIDGWGHAPLSDQAQAAAQAGVDHVRNAFCALVGRQGRIGNAAALATEAAVYADDAAVKAGLADAVGTFADALNDLTAEIYPQRFNSRGNLAMSTTARTELLNSTSGNAATLAGSQPAKPAVAAAAAPATPAASATVDHLAPAATAVVSAEKSADMTPPEPGENCKLCGQMMPKEKAQHAAPAAAAATAVAAAVVDTLPAYGAAEMSETLNLCTIAGVSASKANEFIATKMPVAKVRETLLNARAAASDALQVTRALTDDGNAGESQEQRLSGWRETQKRVKAEMGIGPRK